MSRFKFQPKLLEQVQQIDSAEAEVRRLENLESESRREREHLLQSGKFEDETGVAAVSTLQTKIAMVPHRIRQLKEQRDGVVRGLGPDVQALRNELVAWQESALRVAEGALVPKISAALKPFLGHNAELARSFAETIANRTLVVAMVCSRDPLDYQSSSPLESAKSLLGVAEIFERIEAAFFKENGALDLEAVAKKTAFQLAA